MQFFRTQNRARIPSDDVRFPAMPDIELVDFFIIGDCGMVLP